MFERIRGDRDASRVIATLRRRWWVIVVIAAISAGGAYVLSKRKPKMYAATAALLFQDNHLDQKLFGNQVFTNVDPSRSAATNQALVELPGVADRVAARLHVLRSRVSSEITFGSDTQSDVLTVTATDRSPTTAALLANTYVDQYISFRQEADRAQLAQAQLLVSSQLHALPADQQNSATAQNLRQRADELQLLASLQTGNADPVQTALPPTSPTSPTPTREAMIGLILGLLVGVGLVFGLERRDRRIKAPSEVDEVYGVPVIGTVPESSALRARGAVGTPREQDAFRMIRAQLRYFDVGRDIKRVMVTSADSGEGKSLVALNLARAVAPTDDKRALLIEADLRRPTLGGMIGVEGLVGLAELLSNSQDLATNLQELVVTPEESDGRPAHFDVLLAGSTPPNPVELLESKRMTELMDYAESVYDIVIIDTPPIGVVSDPISLVHQVDGVLVIARLGRSRRDHAAGLMRQLKGLGAVVLGVVINGFQPTAGAGYGYDGYRSQDDSTSSRRWKRGTERQPTYRTK